MMIFVAAAWVFFALVVAAIGTFLTGEMGLTGLDLLLPNALLAVMLAFAFHWLWIEIRGIR